MNKIMTAFMATAAAMTVVSCSQPKEQPTAEPAGTKSLVLYYSQTGTTKAVAEELQRQLGADIASIEAEAAYDGDFGATIARCQEEMKSDSLPALKPLQVDLAKYDTLYLGYPVWFGTYARPMLAWIKQNSLEGKVIVPFCTFGSGGLNTTTEALKADLPKATVLEGYGVRTARIAAMPKELDRFLKESKLVAGEVEPLPAYSEQQPVTDEQKHIFNQACGNYQFPLGTPVTVGVRSTDEGADYMFTASSKGMDGQESTSTIYVTVVNGQQPEFTQVVR